MERYRTTLIMIALLVVLGGVALILTNNNKISPVNATPTPVPSYVWQEPETVLGIDVVSATEKISLRKDISSTTWTITQPLNYPADTFQVDNIASQLQNLQATKVNTTTADLTTFGLDKPGFTVTVTFSGTTPITHTLIVGSSSFDESSAYVKQPNSPDIYLVPTSVIGGMRNWLTTPPKEPATPTPLPTAPPTPTETPTVQPSPAGPVGPPTSSSPSPSVPSSPVATGTPAALGEPTIAVSGPGSGNATTPLAATATSTATP